MDHLEQVARALAHLTPDQLVTLVALSSLLLAAMAINAVVSVARRK